MSTDDSKKHGRFAAAKEGWLKLVASYPNLSGADVAVAIMLSTYFNARSRDAWPAMRRLACDTNRSLSTQRLEKLGLLSRSQHKPNRYRPRMGKLDAKPGTTETQDHAPRPAYANSQLSVCELTHQRMRTRIQNL
jgi:hypothetical protein